MTRFESSGVEPRWKPVYRVLQGKTVGEIITYEEIREALGLGEDAERGHLRAVLYRAAKEFLRVDKHDLEVVPNTGYVVVDPKGHLRNAGKRQKRSYNALKRGRESVVHVDLTGVDVETRKAFEVIAVAFSRQMDYNRRLDIRQQRLEDSLAEVSTRVEETDGELAELRARLERLEQRQPGA